MTGLGKFCHFCKNVKTIWPFSRGLFRTWQIFDPDLAIFYAFGQIFIFVNGQPFEKLCGHLVTLPVINCARVDVPRKVSVSDIQHVYMSATF